MTSADFLQLTVSLSLQITAVVAFTHFAGRLIDEPRVQSRLWTACFSLSIALSGSALSLPHLQVAQPLAVQSMRANAELANLESSIGSAMFRIWFVGIVVSVGLFLYRSLQMSRFLRSCEPLRPDFVRLLTASCGEADLSLSVQGKPVKMITSRAVSSPFCWQFHVPYIVLPERQLTYERNELRLVLQHELEHLGTGHPLQMFLQRSVEILFWFHPMVWWASQQAAITREFVCDDAATPRGPEIVAYLKTLLRIAEETLTVSESVQSSLSFGRHRTMIAERARRLVRRAQHGSQVPPRKPWLMWSVPCLLCIVTAAASSLWIPSSSDSRLQATWSPWPTWSAVILHDVGLPVRDFTIDEYRYRPQEMIEHSETAAY